MGESSKIEWTDHTFNPWWGCTKISSGCANCYADTTATRWGLKIWGDDAGRILLETQYQALKTVLLEKRP